MTLETLQRANELASIIEKCKSALDYVLPRSKSFDNYTKDERMVSVTIEFQGPYPLYFEQVEPEKVRKFLNELKADAEAQKAKAEQELSQL